MDNYLLFAQSLAREAAAVALEHFRSGAQGTWKGDGTPLTEADTRVNQLVIERVRAAFPSHSIYGEEERLDVRGASHIWVCDPIDGTMPFSNGLPFFTFSLALVDRRDGQPILGLVNDPMMERMYWASRGTGAFRNGERIRVSRGRSLERTYLNVDGSKPIGGYSLLKTVARLREEKAWTMQLNSIVYGGIQVANGKFVGALFFEEYAHDVAALKIITEEAGGRVTDLSGVERRYDEPGEGCLISNGDAHDSLLEILRLGRA